MITNLKFWNLSQISKIIFFPRYLCFDKEGTEIDDEGGR